MKRKHKLLNMFLVISLLVGLLPTTVFAAGEMELSDILTTIENSSERPEQSDITKGWYFQDDVIFIKAGWILNGTDADVCNFSVYNQGTISGGTYNKPISNFGGTISGGTFNNDGSVGNTLINANDGQITGGVFECDVYNTGQINGGAFNGKVSQTGGSITQGTFNGELDITGGTLTGGTFKVDVSGLQNITSSNNVATIGAEYSTILTADSGYALPDSITVTMNGTEIVSADYVYDKSTGNLTIASNKVTGIIAVSATGTSNTYGLWIGGVQVTADNMNDITAAINTATPGAASGSATFNPVANTLTLDNFIYTGAGHAFESMGNQSAAAVYSKIDTLNITAYNTNSLSHNAANHRSYGIYTTGNLVITEESTGTITAAGNTGNPRSVGIYLYDGSFTVSGGTIICEGGDATDLSTGVWCFDGDIIVNENGNLTGAGKNGDITRGICASGKTIVNGGTVTGTGGIGGTNSHGISTGSLESNSENSQIISTAGNADESAGIVIWNESAFSKGTITGIADLSTQNQSYGMLLYNRFTIGGGTTIAQGENGAFNNLPVIDSGFSNAGIWYGETETTADASGAKRISALAANYAQKYVRIDSANLPLFDVLVTPTYLSLTEGTIHKDLNAKLTASYVSNADNPSVTYIYQWYSCDENGDNAIAVEDGGSVSNDYEYHISEELASGTYYYFCAVAGYDYDGNLVSVVETDVVKVEISTGTPVVIFDPDFGSFAEIGRVNIELPISNGKITGDVPRPAAEGYAFKGWYTKDGELVSDPAAYTFTHTTKLYARYSMIYTATFDADGGVFGDGTSLYSVEFTDDALDKNKVPEDPTRKDYEFLGWYWKDDDGNEHKLELQPGLDYYELIGDFEFYAKWLKAKPTPAPSDDSTLNPKPEPEPSDDSTPEPEPESSDGLTPEPTPTDEPTAELNPTPSDELDEVPDTGDNSKLEMWLALLCVSGGGLIGITFYERKRSRAIKR